MISNELIEFAELTPKQELELYKNGFLKNKNKQSIVELFNESFKLPVKSDDLSNYTYADLFCGVGGLSLPFYQAGAKCVLAADIDKYARKSYYRNYNHMPMGDITKIDLSKVQDFDILFAGFPCQPYSSAGSKMGLLDKRGSIIEELFRVIEGKKPKYMILENVSNIKTLNSGKDFDYIINKLDSLGYNISHKLINSNQNGSIQSRARVFFFCSLKELGITDFDFITGTDNNTRKLSDILDNDYDDKYVVSDKMKTFFANHKENSQKKGNGFGFCLFDGSETKVSTITSRYYKDGKEIIIDIGSGGMRRLTPQEAFKLQNFPVDFKTDAVSDTQLYRQAGNSVDICSVNCVFENFMAQVYNAD